MTDLVGLLARLQSSTDTILTVPRATTVSDSLLQSWLEAAKILDGEEVILQHKQGLVLQVAFEDEAVPEGSFAVEVPLKIMLGDQEIELGRAVAHFDQPTLLGSQEIEGRIFYTFETSGREIRYGLLPD